MSYTIPNFDCYLVATTVSDGSGKFHPAIKRGLDIRYWPNRKFASEDAAEAEAKHSVERALEAANAVIGTWNVVPL